MTTAVLALLSCVGAWQAWRHSPLHSSRSAFRLLAETALCLLLAAGLIAGAAYLFRNASPVLQTGALLVTVVLATVGLILGLTAATTPRTAVATLPAGVPLDDLHRRAVTHGAKAALWFFAACGLLALIPGPVRYLVGAVALIGALLAAVMLPVAFVMARRRDVIVTALKCDPWMQWRYSADTWKTWRETRMARLAGKPATFVLRRDWHKLLGLCATFVAPSMLFLDGPMLERLGWGLLCTALLIVFVAAATVDERRAPQKLEQRMRRAQPAVWFGQEGLLCEDHFDPWQDGASYLASATRDPRPPVSLEFHFEQITAGYGAATATHVRQVLIPPETAREQLDRLQLLLRRRCPKAEVNLT